MSSLLEIVELANGEIVLRHADGDGRPLINIRFTNESEMVSATARLEVAKAMIQAGMATFAEIVENQEEEAVFQAEEVYEGSEQELSREVVLH
ncbi:hypothetical protein SIN8267_00058 [Sinobacterium norvegicum]|uniref:DUF2694 domain-containing protein n=1 Tax=Sinobacterium norvegicum TaxID=1641715 RepID=A0ABN8EHC9_9GAMM|nr:hypothetical protein [Sinobacterium norvegicum]CAH0989981.1 hypothetical protein SIN8267_00058 [Sinobacterium norvegicum]